MHTATGSSSLLIQLLDGAPGGLAYVEPVRAGNQVVDFQLVYVNQAARHWLGLAGVEQPNPTLKALYPWSVETGLFEELVRAWQTDTPVQHEHRYVSYQQWARLSARRLEEGLAISFEDITPSRLTQQAQAREELLRDILNHSPAGVLVSEAVRDSLTGAVVDLRFVHLNEPAEQILSLKADELVDGLNSELFPHSLTSGLFERYVGVIETGEPITFETDYYADGLMGWYAITARRYQDGLIVTFLDITSSKQAELMQQHQAALLQSVIDNSLTGLVLYEPLRDSSGTVVDFRYKLTNPANARATGRSVGEMTGRRLSELFPHVNQLEFTDRLLAVANTGQPQQWSFQIDVDGINGWFDGRLVAQGDDVLFSFLDITALKQAQLNEQRQANLLRRLLDGSLAGHMAYGAVRDEGGQVVDFQFELINQTGAAIIGRPAESLLGKRLTEEYPGVLTNGIIDRYRRVVDTGEPARFIEHYQADGLDLWLEIQLVPWHDGVVESYADITALKQYELRQQAQNLALQAANLDLKRSNEYLQQFAFVASHDLQEPLRKIQSFSDLLGQQYREQLPDMGQDMLLRIQKAAGRMSDLIRALLAYSRLTTQQQPLRLVSLPQVVETVLADYALTLQRRNAQVSVGALPTLLADPVQMQQLLANLVGNALKYVRPAVTPQITITCRTVGAQELPATVMSTAKAVDITVAGQRSSAFYEISVSDNGIGFEEKYLDRLFGMFQRLHGKTQYEGSGMGLAICKRVVDNHHGYITAHSRPGEGTEFLVYLPIR